VSSKFNFWIYYENDLISYDLLSSLLNVTITIKEEKKNHHQPIN
jgi:hypothetical protein